MNIAFVGCGYVFDIYMRTRWAYPELHIVGLFDIDDDRLKLVSQYYGLRAYASYEDMLSDDTVNIVVNLTTIRSHDSVIEQALLAGKHVYSEKPLTTDLNRTRALFELAAAQELVLTGAPCNLFSDSIITMWRAIRDGSIGKPVLIYAELDDNPAHLMNLENVRSPTGAPFPYVEELQEGCTLEHIGYHLAWICAIFGPATSVTAFSSHLVEHKTKDLLDPADTPDLSVACLTFSNGVAARITCSWVAPRDHSIRVIGLEGQISLDNVFHDQSPLFLERYSGVSLAARKVYIARTQPLVGKVFGIGGRALQLVRRWKSYAVEAEKGVGKTIKHKLVSWLRRKQVYAQDKILGIAEMARAIELGKAQPMGADYLIHLNELTLMIHRSGPVGLTATPSTSFSPVELPTDVVEPIPNYRIAYRARLAEALLTGLIARLHRS